MKIIPYRTIVLILHNGELGLVTGKYLQKWEIETDMDHWTLEETAFISILNLRKKANRFLYTPQEIIERHRISIMNALRKKAVSLTKENQRLRIDVSTSRFKKKN